MALSPLGGWGFITIITLRSGVSGCMVDLIISQARRDFQVDYHIEFRQSQFCVVNISIHVKEEEHVYASYILRNLIEKIASILKSAEKVFYLKKIKL